MMQQTRSHRQQDCQSLNELSAGQEWERLSGIPLEDLTIAVEDN